MIDLQSLLGYSKGSPFSGNPYLDINSNVIDMSNTPIDLWGIDKTTGKKVKMKAGSKNPYIFEGNVREVPVKGNPYQKGGLTNSQIFKFLFDDDEPAKQVPTAPSTEEIKTEEPDQNEEISRQMAEMEDFNMAMGIANQPRRGNPYIPKQTSAPTTPYTGEIISSGQFGNKNVGPYGQQIYGELASNLGYKPVANSIYRSKAQNDALIAAGKPASKTSYHLTGNAVDLKPADWHKLTNEQQAYFRQKYDVIYHDNHYHIEPK